MADLRIISEAFKALKELDEDVFDLTTDGAEGLNDLVSNDNTDDLENIIDPLATTEEELQDSYIGDVILDCVICQSKIYKKPEEVTISEDGTLANIGDECPYCQSSDGYKIIGEVAPYSKTEVDVEVTPKEDGSEEAKVDLTTDDKTDDLDEGLDKDCKDGDCKDKEKDCKDKDCKIEEDLNGVTVDTDKETINITATEKAEDGEEMIAPVEPETEAEFTQEGEDELADEEAPVEPEYQDIDIDEFDENEFDGLGESYLKRVYENVKSYKTTSGQLDGNKIKLEGIITFKSGKQAKTNFVFEAKSVTKTGKVKFLGENKQFAKGNKSFTLTGKVAGNKLITESFTYHYTAKDGKSGASKKLYGTIRK